MNFLFFCLIYKSQHALLTLYEWQYGALENCSRVMSCLIIFLNPPQHCLFYCLAITIQMPVICNEAVLVKA